MFPYSQIYVFQTTKAPPVTTLLVQALITPNIYLTGNKQNTTLFFIFNVFNIVMILLKENHKIVKISRKYLLPPFFCRIYPHYNAL